MATNRKALVVLSASENLRTNRKALVVLSASENLRKIRHHYANSFA